MRRISVTQASNELAAIIEQIESGGEPVMLMDGEVPVAGIVPPEALAALDELEDQLDLAAAEEALAESDERIPWETVRAELGLEGEPDATEVENVPEDGEDGAPLGEELDEKFKSVAREVIRKNRRLFEAFAAWDRKK